MKWTHVLWDPTPGGNVEHIEEHDLATDDVILCWRIMKSSVGAVPQIGLAFSAIPRWPLHRCCLRRARR